MLTVLNKFPRKRNAQEFCCTLCFMGEQKIGLIKDKKNVFFLIGKFFEGARIFFCHQKVKFRWKTGKTLPKKVSHGVKLRIYGAI